jgi:hypothetical protein
LGVILRFLRLAISIAALAASSCSRPPRAAGPLTHDVYVWQRVWSPEVVDAVSLRGTNFSALIALGAEVSWLDGKPSVRQVPLNFDSLRVAGTKVGLALRIGQFSGPFAANDERTRFFIRLAESLVAAARTNTPAAGELQLDFDCAESKLDGYRVWVEAIRNAIKPIPLTITTLPSWLEHSAFKRLVAATDGYVLQVHSLERPKTPDAPFALCDPRLAAQAVERAGRLGIPFRVALPTYGYLLAFDPTGKFIGLSAEGPLRNWPEGSTLREVRAQPVAIAGLVRMWTRDRPEALNGIIWYRLPIAGDKLNWSWPTLTSVMAGRTPTFRLREELRKPQPGLVEIDLLNAGDGDYEGPIQMKVRWSGARLIASDGWFGVENLDAGPDALRFQARKLRLPAGDRRSIGWLRLDKETEVQIEKDR